MKRILATISGVSALFFATTGHAALIGANEAGLGAGDDGFNLTVDTATGLEWADLSLAQEPFDNIKDQFAALGFRRATRNEVVELFANAGLVDPDTGLPFNELTVNVDGAPPASVGLTDAEFQSLFAVAETLIQMLGQTGGNSTDVFRVSGTTEEVKPESGASQLHNLLTVGITYSPFVTIPPGGCLGKAGDPGCFERGLSIVTEGTGPSDSGAVGDAGIFFVRGSDPIETSAPAGFGLTLLGAAALYLRRRRT